jgi:pSer/pThr/pTyr-binding forkhead associated (FHA) protein/outer membrane protein assembly factor BamB
MLQLKFKKAMPTPVDLKEGRLTVGRDQSNDVVLDDDGISGFHAEIQTEDGNSFLVDLGSTNGTYINGKKISGRQTLKAWATLRFDQVEAEVVDPDRRRPTTVHKAIGDADLAGGKTAVRPAAGGWALKGCTGAMAGKVFPLAGKKIIGRDGGCDLAIDATMVSTRHASIEISGNSVKLTDLNSTNGTFVNGKKVTEAVLQAGDEVRFDQIAFTVEGPAGGGKTAVRPAVGAGGTQLRSAVAPSGTRMVPTAGAFLKVTAGKVTRQRFDLKGSRLTIGRTDQNDIVLEDDTVSSSHGLLTLFGNTWHIEDKGSANGTFVNGKKITSTELKPGDRLQVGEVKLSFEEPAQPAGSTKLMPAAGTATKTSVSPAIKKGIPAWAYGLIAFLVVGAALFFFLGKTKSGQIDAKLQAGKLWARQISGRQMPTTPALADINGDGFLDVIVADANGYVLALDGAEGKQIFQAEAMDRILAPPVTADLSGDKIPDVVVASNSGIVTALNGKGQTLWKSDPSLNLGEIINRPVLIDLNGDGTPDVIVPTAAKGLVALDGARGWQIWNTAEMTRGKVITAPLKADIDSDGTLDFVSVTDQGQVLALSAQKDRVWQIWEARVPVVYYASPMFFKAGDQGLVVIATNNGGIVALRADSGRPAWSANIQKRFFATPMATDANGDKVPDVVAVADNGDIHVLDGTNGDEIWRAALGTAVQATPALMDVNEDGLKDLIILDTAGNLRIVDMARGREALGLNVADADGFISSPVLGDMNNDQMVDIVSAAKNTMVSVYSLNRMVGKGAVVWGCFLGEGR